MNIKYSTFILLLFLTGCKSIPNENESKQLINYVLLNQLPFRHELNSLPNLSQQLANAKVKTLKIESRDKKNFIKFDSLSQITYLSENKNVIYNLEYFYNKDFIFMSDSLNKSLQFRFNKTKGVFEKLYKKSDNILQYTFSKKNNNLRISYYNNYINFTNNIELQEMGYNDLNLLDRILGVEIPYIVVNYDKKDYSIIFNSDDYFKNNELIYSKYKSIKAIYKKEDNSIIVKGLNSNIIHERIILDSLYLPQIMYYNIPHESRSDTIYFEYTFYN